MQGVNWKMLQKQLDTVAAAAVVVVAAAAAAAR